MKHDTWVNRYIAMTTGSEDQYPMYRATCLCGEWEGESQDNPDDAHDEGVQHMVTTADPLPDHMGWVNIGIEWLDTNGAKRVVYTPICTCQWMGDRTTSKEEAWEKMEAHEANPVVPDEVEDDA